MNFEWEIYRLKDTLALVVAIQRRQTEARKIKIDGTALHEQRMAYIDMRLAEITEKLNRMDGYFRRPQ